MHRRFALPLTLSLSMIMALAQRQRPQESGTPPPSPAAGSQQATPGTPATPAATPPAASGQFPAPPAVEHLSKTDHTITINGKTIPYTATAGTLVLKREDEHPLASIFFVSYTRNDITDKSKWPITYAFNGGPGSASIWLHLGALGPKRVVMADPEGRQPAPPYQLTDNESTLLSISDMVFIDPVTTGFSRNAPGENPAQFHSVEGDLESVANFIRLYTTRFDRWASPKFIAGESYGTTRAAGLSQLLLQQGIYLNGITLLSSVLNFETISFAVGNDLPYVVYLPSYTATAWYHKKLPPDLQAGDLQKAIDESRHYAANGYTIALMKGSHVTPQERSATVKQLARLTGLSETFIDEANLRVSLGRFTKELLRDERRTVGRYDSRLEGIDIDAAGDRPEYDPSYAAVYGVYTAMFNDYVRKDLKYDSDLPYEVLTGKVQPWSYAGRATNQYLNVAEGMRQAMTQNPAMHVLVGAGYYDLATPFFAAEYTADHLELAPSLQNHLTMYYCDAGHMLYMKKACLDSFHQAMEGMYQLALGGK